MKPLAIAIAEDEWFLAEYLSGEIAVLGHTVVARARTGGELINLVARERPDLVLVDVHLARGRDGLAAVKEIQERFRHSGDRRHRTSYRCPG
jgi:CheY-like chemotaxis protein